MRWTIVIDIVKELSPFISSVGVAWPAWLLQAGLVGRGDWPWTSLIVVTVTFVVCLSILLACVVLTRLRKINVRLAQANRELEAMDLVKSRFLRMSSHQLRSPLAAIHSMLSALQEVGGLNFKQYEVLQKIQARTEESMALMDEMMLLSTIKENAAETKDLKPIDVDATLKRTAADFAEESANRRLTLKVQADSGSKILAWDDALETMLEHLISNATKYTVEGGSVFVGAVRDGDNVQITVSDSGIGIPAGQREGLFREFFRATNARQMAGGTGMGLATVKAIVDRLGGEIAITSDESGTVVHVILPAHVVNTPKPMAGLRGGTNKNIC
jgi:signal transduction histidine kinase